MAKGDRIAWWGTIDAAVFLTFKSNVSEGAHRFAKSDNTFELCNQSLYFWEMKFNTGDRVVRILRQATKEKPRFRWYENTFTTDYHTADEFNEIFEAYDAGTLKLTVSLRVWYHAFFRHVLHEQRRQTVDLKNLANADEASQIQKSAVPKTRKKKSDFVFEEDDMSFFDVPAVLSEYEVVENATPGFIPTVKMIIHLRTQEELEAADADEFAEVMMACDWTKLNGYGRDGPKEAITTNFPPETTTDIVEKIRVWEKNLVQYFAHYTNLERGRHIFDGIAKSALAAAGPKTNAGAVVGAVRDGIDRFMITSNHWGHGREDEKGEAYQLHMSNVFGSIHGSSYRASPVYIYRLVRNRLDLTTEEQTAFILCTGAGHCNEHGLLAFELLSKLHDADAALGVKLSPVVLSGNANIDHVFVVAGLPPALVVETRVAAANNSAFTKADGTPKIGEKIELWDLKSAIGDAPRGSSGFVCDAYLSRKQGPETTRQLLKSLLSQHKKAKRKATPFIRLSRIHPMSAAKAFVEFRRLPSVKNI